MSDVSAKRRNDGGAIAVRGSDEVYVGLDVHKETIHAAVWLNGRMRKTWSMPADVAGAIRALEPFRGAVKEVVYEAGPTGYSLARGLQEAGLPVAVVAPSLTPRTSGRDSKSDRLDCRKLAEFAAAGLLRPTAIPSPQEESERQILRQRDQLISKRRRVKQQIKSFLLQHGIATPPTLCGPTWSKAGVKALHQLSLPDNLRFCLDVLLTELDHFNQCIERVKNRMRTLSRQARFSDRLERLQTHPGVGPVVALSFLTEMYQAERFPGPREVARYVGLAPQVRQSGQTRREGPILKTGRSALRSLLVEAAWQWVRKDPAAAAIYGRLVCNTGRGKKAIVAMARKLAINLWMMLIREESYRSPAVLAR